LIKDQNDVIFVDEFGVNSTLKNAKNWIQKREEGFIFIE
jgi:hypothetical protein